MKSFSILLAALSLAHGALAASHIVGRSVTFELTMRQLFKGSAVLARRDDCEDTCMSALDAINECTSAEDPIACSCSDSTLSLMESCTTCTADETDASELEESLEATKEFCSSSGSLSSDWETQTSSIATATAPTSTSSAHSDGDEHSEHSDGDEAPTSTALTNGEETASPSGDSDSEDDTDDAGRVSVLSLAGALAPVLAFALA